MILQLAAAGGAAIISRGLNVPIEYQCLLILIAWTTVSAIQRADTEIASVIKVITGSKLKVKVGRKIHIITLAGCIAPALREPHGVESAAALKEAIGNRLIHYRVVRGKSEAIVKVGRINLNRQQIERGHCWHDASSCIDPELDQSAISARYQNIGVYRHAPEHIGDSSKWTFS